MGIIKDNPVDIIEDFMSTPVLSVDVDTSVEEAAKEMLEKGVSCLLVNEKEDSVGIITATDLVKRVIAKGLDARTTKIQSVMSKPIISINHYWDRSDASNLMQKNKIKHLAVTDQKKMVGILTPNDMLW